jgi:hypothetical protein
MSRKAGCGFRAAQALKIPAAKVRAETFAKQVVVLRKAKLRGIPRRCLECGWGSADCQRITMEAEGAAMRASHSVTAGLGRRDGFGG